MKESKNLMEGIHENSTWKEITDGGFIYGSGNSRTFATGEWRTKTPVWNPEKCQQCLLCFPVCPDSSIPVEDSERKDFDYDHCKGCGICEAVCPFDAISFPEETKEGEKNE